MTTQKQLAARRQRNQALARRDTANRCAWCKVALGSGPYVVLADEAINQRRFCSVGCADDALVSGERSAKAGAR